MAEAALIGGFGVTTTGAETGGSAELDVTLVLAAVMDGVTVEFVAGYITQTMPSMKMASAIQGSGVGLAVFLTLAPQFGQLVASLLTA